MQMTSILFSIISAVAAVGGGAIALKNIKRLHLMLGFTAGAILGLVAFGLIPEIAEHVNEGIIDIKWPMIALVVGFLLFHIVEKVILMHESQEKEYTVHKHPHVGKVSAAALIGHSFLDGASIGLAFHINEATGVAVALAVIAHRFADGFNGINIMLNHDNTRKASLIVLACVAVAPILGAVVTQFLAIPEGALVVYLGFFAGFMLYISASDILPQAHSKGATKSVLALTILGVAVMFVVTHFAHVH